MTITSHKISEYKQSRDKFNTYYNNVILDILILKRNYNLNIQELQYLKLYMTLILYIMLLKL